MQNPCRSRRAMRLLVCVLVLAAMAGCASSYCTPGRGADLSLFGAEGTLDAAPAPPGSRRAIEERLRRRPAATFPVHLAIVRVQAPGYHSYTSRGRGSGRYSVVAHRDVETDEDLGRLAALPAVAGVAAVGGLVVPPALQDDEDLRSAAATLQCDMVLIYTFDTIFGVADTVEPLGVVTLGLFPSKQARVSSTASAILLDTRTGYVYGVAEASAKREQIANAWTSEEAVDQSRLRAERAAFDGLLGQFATLWPGVVAQHAGREGATPASGG